MGRVSSVAVLLCALAFVVNGSPYSKIAEGVQFGDGFASKKSSSSSLSSSSSYAQSNHGNVEIDGLENGQAFVGMKSVAYSKNGASQSSSYSSSLSSSGSGIPIGLVSSSQAATAAAATAAAATAAAATAAALANHRLSSSLASSGYDVNVVGQASPFWWMRSESPFLADGKPSSSSSPVGCTPNGCLASTVFRATEDAQGATKDIAATNPFLRGSGFAASYPASYMGSSGASLFASNAATSDAVRGTSFIGASNNPFLRAGSSGYGSSGSSSGGATTFQDSSSLLNSGNSGTVTFGQAPFGHTSAQLPGFPLDYPQVEQNAQQQQTDVFPGYPVAKPPQQPTHANDEGAFTVTCTGENRRCVPYYLCSAKGYVNTNGLAQIRSGSLPQSRHTCDLNNEVCCNIPEEATSGTSGQGEKTEGGFSGTSNDPAENSNNGYLPPNGESPSSHVPAFTNPPKDEGGEVQEPDRIGGAISPVPTSIFPPPASPPPQVGCAAALLCVEEQYCSMQGVITTEPVALSSEQLIRRVPLSSCKNPENGIIGKCCRDPNYVDPWPAGNLPANYSGGFDEQGFPTILNLSKTRPVKKQPPNGAGATKGATKGGRPFTAPQQPNPFARPAAPSPIFGNQFPARTPQETSPYIGTVRGSPSPYAGASVQSPSPYAGASVQSPSPYAGASVQSPSPYVGASVQSPSPYAGAPVQSPSPYGSTDEQPTPFVRNNYDTSPTNHNPTILASHVPGSRCGRRNTVQRPEGLNDAEVAFGEIPWQAMILSNTDRKLLCSGAIVAPNAVVTAASCVHGLSPEQVSIKSGEWKLGYELKHEEPLPFEIVKVVSIAPYPSFSPGNPAHDIALLFLEHELKLDQHVDALCLPEGQPGPPRPGAKCIATGWGKTVLQVNVAGALMHGIDVDVLDEEQCLARLAVAENQIPLDDTLFCAKARKRNNNMCQVDFGGPLACERPDGSYELAGIYNQDTGCLPTNQVSTFAEIPSRWIEESIASPLEKKPQSLPQQPNHLPQPCNCYDQGGEQLASGRSIQYLPPV